MRKKKDNEKQKSAHPISKNDFHTNIEGTPADNENTQNNLSDCLKEMTEFRLNEAGETSDIRLDKRYTHID